jgi:dTDP-4-dehydrorhamnose reductase
MKRLKVLVLGSTGLIGHQVYNHLDARNEFDMFNIAYRKKLNDGTVLCDIRQEENFLKTIKEFAPDIIINAIGILIDSANKDPENAIFINAYMPHRLKRFANEIGSKLIHISTDCVFSGRKGNYTEIDEKDAYDTYGRTKALGEITDKPHLTLRTSVIGPELKADGEELFHWFMTQKKQINGYTASIWSGVTTLELAKAVYWAIKSDITGLYHITNGMPINKYELLTLCKTATGKDIIINAIEGRIVDKSFIDTRKERSYTYPSYSEMIYEMVDLMKHNSALYEQYGLS